MVSGKTCAVFRAVTEPSTSHVLTTSPFETAITSIGSGAFSTSFALPRSEHWIRKNTSMITTRMITMIMTAFRI
jgi:hypothetical protein